MANERILRLENNETFAVLSKDGKLIKFDNKLCREIAAKFDPNNFDTIKTWAKLIVTILDAAGEEVSHIRKEGGGNQGDLIKGFNR